MKKDLIPEKQETDNRYDYLSPIFIFLRRNGVAKLNAEQKPALFGFFAEDFAKNGKCIFHFATMDHCVEPQGVFA